SSTVVASLTDGTSSRAIHAPRAGAGTGAGGEVVVPGSTVWVTVTFGRGMIWVWCARTRTTAHHRPSARPKASKLRSSHFNRTLVMAAPHGRQQSSLGAFVS